VAEVWGSEDAPSQIPSQPEEGSLGEEMGRSNELGRGANQQKKVQVAEEPAAEPNGGTSAKTPSGIFPPAQNGALPYRLIPEVDEERGWGGVLVVSIQDTDERASAQALQEMEAAAEDPVGGGKKGDRKREEPVHDPGTVRGRAVHQRDPRFFAHHEVGEQGGPEGGGATGTDEPTDPWGFFCLIILAFDLYRSWRRTFCPVFLSAVRAVAARCKLPLCPPPRPVPKKSRCAQGN